MARRKIQFDNQEVLDICIPGQTATLSPADEAILAGRLSVEQQKACQCLSEAVKNKINAPASPSDASNEHLDLLLWNALEAFQNYPFLTAKKLEFSYVLKGYEMFVSRKDKSITKATVLLSFHNALSVQALTGRVAGPKKLGTFGASYLYPVFLFFGIITA